MNETTIISSKKKAVALFLCLGGGMFGAHHFYVGNFGKGFKYIFTFGLLGFGWISDIFKTASGNLLDNSGAPVRK